MKNQILHSNFKNGFLISLLLFVSVGLFGQCGSMIVDVSAINGNPAGTNISIPNANCSGPVLTGGLPNSLNGGGNITINGMLFEPGVGACDGSMNEIFNAVGGAPNASHLYH